VEVTTYHYDLSRTGWNPRETVLTPGVVQPGSFGLLRSVPLDEQVDGQPLVVARMAGGARARDIVYVATENNTLYAIDAADGTVIHRRSFGPPVTAGKGGTIVCGNNSSVIGITSTPVIDSASATLYAVAFTTESGEPVYQVHGVDLDTLDDKIPMQIVAASTALTDGSTFNFVARHSRQRAALTLANGAVYAAFASFCDHDSDVTRGWLLGWDAKTLAPLPASVLTDHRAHSSSNFYLSSIWMSGYGPAVDPIGNLYVITGNSKTDGAGPTPSMDPKLSLRESVVKMRGDLSGEPLDYFTPSDADRLDLLDNDFGSGGALLIPGEQPGSHPHLAIAAGKVGQMFLLDRDNLGKFSATGPNKVLASVNIGRCWCGQSYYVGPDETGRIISSGGDQLSSWRLVNAPNTTLVKDWDGPTRLGVAADVFQKGFFTSISSDGTTPGHAIIWAVQRPTAQPPALTLWGFDAANGTKLVSVPAGDWPNTLGAANTIPVVANGRVFVASYKQLGIFGLSQQVITAATPASGVPISMARSTATFYGSVVEANPSTLWLRTRTRVARVDIAQAERNRKTVTLAPGRAVAVTGSVAADGTIIAASIDYAPDSPALWTNGDD
jgi:outer membrane protein assembly factor BamB